MLNACSVANFLRAWFRVRGAKFWVKFSRLRLRMVEFFLRFTTTVGNLGREKIDFIGVAPLLATKTSLLWPTNTKNRNKHLKINIISSKKKLAGGKPSGYLQA